MTTAPTELKPNVYLSDVAMRIAVELEAQSAVRATTVEKAEAICDILSTLEPQAVDDAMVERATHLLEWLPSAYHHCKHGTQDWCESYLKNAVDVIRAQDARIAALTAALQAAKEPSHEAG